MHIAVTVPRAGKRWPFAAEFLRMHAQEREALATGQPIAAWAIGAALDRNEHARMVRVSLGVQP